LFVAREAGQAAGKRVGDTEFHLLFRLPWASAGH
jgi:hypothetical protein